MSAHPLLTKVLAEMLANGPDWESEGYPFIFLSTGLLDRCVAAIPPAIADRLEAALDVCQSCHCPERWVAHTPGVESDTPGEYHPFVPLVTP